MMIKTMRYDHSLELIKSMTPSQLRAFILDIDCIDTIELIAETSFYILKEYESEVANKKSTVDEIDEQEDWKEQDDAQRYRDIQSDNRRPY